MGTRRIRWMLLLTMVAVCAGRAEAKQSACFPEGSGQTGCLPVVTIPTDWTRCTSDADCVRVAWSCCDCFAGGISTAINPIRLDRYEQRWTKLCPDFTSPTDPLRCPQEITCASRASNPGGEPEFAAPFCNQRGRCELGFRE